jgi:hypothetical protein
VLRPDYLQGLRSSAQDEKTMFVPFLYGACGAAPDEELSTGPEAGASNVRFLQNEAPE